MYCITAFGLPQQALGGTALGSDCGREEYFCSRAGLVGFGTAAGAGLGALIGLVMALIR